MKLTQPSLQQELEIGGRVAVALDRAGSRRTGRTTRVVAALGIELDRPRVAHRTSARSGV